MCRERAADDGAAAERGFTLLEVLAALAITGFVLSAIGSVVAVTSIGLRSLGDRVALAQTSRRLRADLLRRDRLVPGTTTGTLNGLSWRLDVGAAGDAIAAASRLSPAWVPVATVLTVQAPSGRLIRLDGVRLVREATR